MRKTAPNFKLIAIFGLPLLGVTCLFQFSKRYVDVFDGDENLATLVRQAKEAGFPFDASELATKGVPDSNNGYIPLKELFLDKSNPLPKNTREVSDYWYVDNKELQPGVAELIARSKKVASKTQLDVKRDYNEPLGVDFSEYSHLKTVVKALCYDALHAAKHGDDARAIESMRLAKNIPTQLSWDKPIIGDLVNLACQAIYYAGVGNVAYEMRGRNLSLARLRALLDGDIPAGSLETSMKVEFFSSLSTLQKYSYASILGGYSDVSVPDNADARPPILEDGLPKSAANRAMLAKVIARYLKMDAIRRSVADPQEAADLFDKILELNTMAMSSRILDFVFNSYSSVEIARRKRFVYRDMARWTVDICEKYPSTLPDSLPPRHDVAFGGELRYRKLPDRFVIYSTGPDRKDSGGPTASEEERKTRDRGDDIGVFIPVRHTKPPSPSTSSGGPAVPGGRPPGALD